MIIRLENIAFRIQNGRWGIKNAGTLRNSLFHIIHFLLLIYIEFMNRIKRFRFSILLFFIFAIHISCLSQNKKIDSLLSVLKTTKEDTTKINTLNDIGWELKNNNPDTAIILCTRALALAEATKWRKGIAGSLRNLGAFNYLKGNYPQALQHYFKALKINEELKDKKGISAILGNIGIVYRNQTDYPKALDYYFKALKIGEELGDKNRIAIQLGNIGIVYDNQKDYPKALDYYFRALKMDEELGNKNNIAALLGNIGSVYDEQASAMSSDSADIIGIKSVEQERLYNKALDWFFKALKVAEELGGKNRIAADLGNIGSIYTDLNKYKKAEDYLLRALLIDTSIGSIEGQKYRHNDLSKLYSKTGRHKLALEHYKKYIAARDSINNDENTKKQTRTEMQFEFSKKQTADSVKVAEGKKLAAAELKSEVNKRYSLYMGLFLVVVFAGFIFNRFRVTQKQKIIIESQKEIVEEQKKIVEEKNKDITDSIHYARRIQRALLPTEKYIEKNFRRLSK